MERLVEADARAVPDAFAAGAQGRIASSLRAEWLDLPPPVAGVLIKAGMLLLLASVAWRFRRPAPEREEDVILWEAAVVSLMTLLYSPLTWRQHCVAVLPAFYLICRTHRAKGGFPRWMRAALGVYVFFVLLLDRGVVGRDVTLILDSFGATTWSLLLLLAVTLGYHAREAKEVVLRKGLPFDVAMPNLVTRRAMREVQKGRGLTKYKDTAEMREKLGL